MQVVFVVAVVMKLLVVVGLFSFLFNFYESVMETMR